MVDAPPDRVGTTFDGDPVLLSKYQGTAVVISFWATWCQYCLKELPVLDSIQRVAKERVRVIAVNTEEPRRVPPGPAGAGRAPSSLDLVYDPDNERARRHLACKGIPHMVIIGRDGKIVSVYRGYDESSLERHHRRHQPRDRRRAGRRRAISRPAPGRPPARKSGIRHTAVTSTI